MARNMVRSGFRRSLGVTDKGRKLHVMYPATGHFGYINTEDVGGCGVRKLHRASEDQKRAMVYCNATGCAGVPHE